MRKTRIDCQQPSCRLNIKEHVITYVHGLGRLKITIENNPLFYLKSPSTVASGGTAGTIGSPVTTANKNNNEASDKPSPIVNNASDMNIDLDPYILYSWSVCTVCGYDTSSNPCALSESSCMYSFGRFFG